MEPFQYKDKWISVGDITNDVLVMIPFWMLRKVEIDDRTEEHTFIVNVYLRWWTWLCFGAIHRRYKRELEYHCEQKRVIGIVGKVRVR